ncbi:MAG: T9SS type A sorting domain-containing protein [Bacteroidetes bacterium]|nr:T9SS type A sorting domain-containing protein [Bacteroidota bacterium]
MNTVNIVNSLSGTPALLIKPNPAQSFVELQNISEQLDQFSVYVYDNLGRIVLQVESSPNLKLDIDQLVPGIYSLHILESNQSSKFIKY